MRGRFYRRKKKRKDGCHTPTGSLSKWLQWGMMRERGPLRNGSAEFKELLCRCQAEEQRSWEPAQHCFSLESRFNSLSPNWEICLYAILGAAAKVTGSLFLPNSFSMSIHNFILKWGTVFSNLASNLGDSMCDQLLTVIALWGDNHWGLLFTCHFTPSQ